MNSPLVALLIAASVSVGTGPMFRGGRQPGTGAPGGEKGGKPEPTYTFSPREVFDDALSDARSAPLAERLTVSVKQAEQSPASANIVLRIAPGKERDQRDAQVSIDAGPLRIFAQGGTPEASGAVTVISTANPAAYYRVALDGPPTLAALSAALNPLPLPTLAIFFAPGGAPVADPTPLTRKIAWEPVTVLVSDAHPKLTLAGAIEGKPGASIVFEHQQDRLRFRSFASPLSGSDARTLTVTAVWIEAGDPKSWTIDVAGRTRVDTLAALGSKAEPPAAADLPKKPETAPPSPEAVTPKSETKPPAPAATDPPKPGPNP